MMMLCAASFAQDPNFHIYLAFGQSNMEGNAQPEAIDRNNVPERFQLLATCNNTNVSPQRTTGKWYKATPPLVNPNGGLGPCDWFGRTMVEQLPNVKIGVIPVAMGGSPIEMFDKDKYQQKMKDNPNEWWAQLARNHYGSNPYGRLIDMAKIAQKAGVIKGILLHQGCSNCNDPNWPNMVKKIYNDILNDLGLTAEEVPLLVGEVLYADMGGSCSSHNNQVARMPQVVPTSYVISAAKLPGNGNDPWHFSAAGYRELGRRYAEVMLSILEKNESTAEFSVTDLTVRSSEMTLTPGQNATIAIYGNEADGTSHNITRRCDFTIDDENIAKVDGIKVVAGNTEGTTTIHVSFKDKDGKTVTTDITVKIEMFPLTESGLNPSLSGSGTFNGKTLALTTGKDGLGGWKYTNGIDISDYKYLVVRLRLPSSAKPTLRIYNTSNAAGDYYEIAFQRQKEVVIELKDLKTVGGKDLDLKKVQMIGFSSSGSATVYLSEIFFSNDGENPITGIDDMTFSTTFTKGEGAIYNIQGQRINALKKGLYIINGKKIMVR